MDNPRVEADCFGRSHIHSSPSLCGWRLFVLSIPAVFSSFLAQPKSMPTGWTGEGQELVLSWTFHRFLLNNKIKNSYYYFINLEN